MAAHQSRARGGLEHEVLAALAAAGRPMTPAQVRDEIGHDTAYTTVMTTLARLHTKQVLQRAPAGRAYAYSIVGSPQDAPAAMAAHRMHRLLQTQPDRSEVLTRFVARLGPDDERLLSRLLEREGDPSPATRRPRRGRRT